MSEWQPIETAPKDGTLVLLWPGSRTVNRLLTVCSAYWHQPANPKVSGMWVGQFVTRGSYITHWMPLPEPPKDQDHG